ncbi:lysylphosphatidylglycerol synthase transmembrane domain-containing protein [Roseivirga sp.]|uniref:lysylphosphatidylglycerol synthase transmembrane domain-containing protein n=1 Tax=Roseivirga sp. TaxID=1964215 RepID=UPI003B8DF412
MRLSLKDFFKLVFSIALTGFVIYNTNGDFEWSKAKDAIINFNFGWIFLSIGLSLISHLLRAYRWNLLLSTQGHKPKLLTSYLALMVGYLSSMAIPRLGEVTRCTVLKKSDNIPVSFSFGTVITDRLLDLLMLGLLLLSLLALKYSLLQSFFIDFIERKAPFILDYWPYLILLGIAGIIFLYWLIRKSKEENSGNGIVSKLLTFIKDFLIGLKAITQVKKPFPFILSTLGIWLLYFLMLYVISFGYGPTDDMSPIAGLAVLVMGSFGMATPVNNGIGAYQVFVAGILVAFGIAYEDGYVFAVISQGSQLVTVIIIGFLSLVILNFRKKKQIETDSAKDS